MNSELAPMQTDSGNLLFVYGTLKRGFCRHSALAGQTFVGTATTTPVYKLIDLGSYPGLVHDKTGQSIRGELYQVDVACMARLDVVEGVASGLYRQEPIRLAGPNSISAISYFYLGNVEGSDSAGEVWDKH